MDTLTTYHCAKAAREAAEAMLNLVSPGLRWADLKPALARLAELKRVESEACRAYLAEALPATVGEYAPVLIATAA